VCFSILRRRCNIIFIFARYNFDQTRTRRVTNKARFNFAVSRTLKSHQKCITSSLGLRVRAVILSGFWSSPPTSRVAPFTAAMHLTFVEQRSTTGGAAHSDSSIIYQAVKLSPATRRLFSLSFVPRARNAPEIKALVPDTPSEKTERGRRAARDRKSSFARLRKCFFSSL